MRTMTQPKAGDLNRLCGHAARHARLQYLLYSPNWTTIDDDEWARLEVPNFSPREVADTRTGEVLIDVVALREMQMMRRHAGRAIPITSGYRSPYTNAKVGGHPSSAHMAARAFDFEIVSSIAADNFMRIIPDSTFEGVGLRAHGDRKFMHVDDVVRSDGRSRLWTYA